MLDISIILIVLLLGFQIKNWVKEPLTRSDRKNLDLLWVYHVIITITFYFYINKFGGDAKNYWFTVKTYDTLSFMDYLSLGYGTYFIYAVNYFPSRILELSFLTGTMIYSLIGYIGFVFFYLIFKKRIHYNTKYLGVNLFPLLLFLPNLHFWTSGVGKDSLMFCCIGIVFYGMQQPRQHLLKIFIALVLAYFTRPHIALFLALAFGLGYLFQGKLKLYQKAFFITAICVGFIIFFDSLMIYLRIEDLSVESFNQFAESSTTKLGKAATGSRVDMTSYPFVLKVFTFLYRPLFFDSNGILAILASVENLMLLILSVRFFWLNPFKLFLRSDYFFKSMFVFFVLGAISFSLILGNLGIMLRQKNMFIPILLFLCLWAFSYNTQRRDKTLITDVG